MRENNQETSRRFICIIDKSVSAMDYNEEQECVRLLGFDLEAIDESETVELYTFDILSNEFYGVRSQKGNEYVKYFSSRFFTNELFSIISFELSSEGKSYFYKSYGNEEPVNISISKIGFQSYCYPNFKNHVLALSYVNNMTVTYRDVVSILHDKKFKLIAYSVGQGMCSLLHDGEIGYLLDAGAGKPVLRGNYQKKLINNDLQEDIKGLNSLSLILSHLDSDHFRIIRWDEDLLGKIDKIYIPSGVSWLDSKQKGIAKKVIAIDEINIKSPNLILNGVRTVPKASSSLKNDNEIICHLSLNNNQSMLYPGDYTYSKMKSDRNSLIPPMTACKFDFIVVPHHGDHDSQYCIPSPKCGDSVAFFSAGNHQSWNHPHSESVREHGIKGFNSLTNKFDPNIVRIKGY